MNFWIARGDETQRLLRIKRHVNWFTCVVCDDSACLFNDEEPGGDVGSADFVT